MHVYFKVAARNRCEISYFIVQTRKQLIFYAETYLAWLVFDTSDPHFPNTEHLTQYDNIARFSE